MDVIGLACLGIEMNNLSSPSAFALAYEVVFQNTAWSAIMSALSIYLPIRRLIPIEANRAYLGANTTIRTLLRQRIRERKPEIQESKEKVVPSLNGKDVLSMMIRERGQGDEIWTEDEMLGHVSISDMCGLILLTNASTINSSSISWQPVCRMEMEIEI